MNDLLKRALGRSSLVLDRLRPVALRLSTRRSEVSTGEFDRTGLVLEGEDARVLWEEGDVVVVRYASLALSLWRSQEVSLFRGIRDRLERPILDFGCGDGSFGSLVFDEIDYGVDNDPLALAHCEQQRRYRNLLLVADSDVPLPDGAVASVFSNSVLEHVSDVDSVLRELHRVLRPGGVLAATIVTKGYERHVAHFFGRRESERLTRVAVHRNVFESGDWERIFAESGFSVERVDEFQPREFTFVCRMARLLGKRGLGMLAPGAQDFVWRRYGRRIAGLVRRSVSHAEDGANVFMVARKP